MCDVHTPLPESRGGAGRWVRPLAELPELLSHADRQLRSESPHKDTADEKKQSGIKNSARLLRKLSANTFCCSGSVPPAALSQDGFNSETDWIQVFHSLRYFCANIQIWTFTFMVWSLQMFL